MDSSSTYLLAKVPVLKPLFVYILNYSDVSLNHNELNVNASTWF